MSGRFGPLCHKNQETTFRLWAPAAARVELLLDDAVFAMTRLGDGWFALVRPDAGTGSRYCFRIDDKIDVPDPASQFQPEDVHGTSEIIDHDYAWNATGWRGRPWHEAVILELHVGTFTPEGTFRSAIHKLGDVAAVGFTAIELMPVADFAGRWNWGYDGVLLFAPDSTYGRPEDLKALIDAAHQHGLMVFLDVVYNHFGPEGNYLGLYAPRFFTSHHTTPWGDAIDYRVPEVRAFAIENAVHWLNTYRFDGLRLDAVHAIVEPGEPSVLEEISRAVGALAARTHRHIHLVLENDDNRANLLDPTVDPPAGRYRAQWNDDYHHAWHVFLTGEGAGYYRDYHDAAAHIARTLAHGFAYQGEPSPYRDGLPRGEPSRHLPRTAFVNFIQNHDQIGNRPKGERLSVLATPEALAAALSVLLLQPSPPLMFMGDEWAAIEPFPFFCDFRGDLADAVRNGRKKEFADAYSISGADIPDPLSAKTCAAASLDWGARARPAHAKRLALTRSLLAARKRWIVPLLPTMIEEALVFFNSGVLSARWPAGKRNLLLLANLSDGAKACPDESWGEPVWGEKPSRELPPWSVYAAIEG
jgi:maltooligosyltrehalose trehalohydrolase